MAASKSRPMSTATILGLTFGAVFCFRLTYLWLRDAPLQDAGQLHMQRVGFAVIGAVAGAVLAGFFKGWVLVGQPVFPRALIALAAFCLVYALNPAELIHPFEPPSLLIERVDARAEPGTGRLNLSVSLHVRGIPTSASVIVEVARDKDIVDVVSRQVSPLPSNAAGPMTVGLAKFDPPPRFARVRFDGADGGAATLSNVVAIPAL